MPRKALQFRYLRTPEELARAAAVELHGLLQRRIPQGPFGIALSGGRIAAKFYDALDECLRPSPGSLTDVHFFWADERCVPPHDPENNYFIARHHLFDPLNIPSENVHRIRGETDLAFAVQEAESELCRIMPLNEAGQPILDVIILGMGEDGHVASLFPGETPDLIGNPAVYRHVRAAKPPPDRITLGYPALAAAREAWVLVSGAGKETALRGLTKNSALPIHRVLLSRGELLIFQDVVSGLDLF
jgi:6-phosphogluconolactonase